MDVAAGELADAENNATQSPKPRAAYAR